MDLGLFEEGIGTYFVRLTSSCSAGIEAFEKGSLGATSYCHEAAYGTLGLRNNTLLNFLAVRSLASAS